MEFLKKILGTGKKEEEKVDDEVIGESIENKEEVNDEIIDDPIEIGNNESIGDMYEFKIMPNGFIEVGEVDSPLDSIERTVISSMNGMVIKLNVNVGDKVIAGSTVCVVEAMKMENDIQSEVDGVVEEIFVESGNVVNAGDALMVICDETIEIDNNESIGDVADNNDATVIEKPIRNNDEPTRTRNFKYLDDLIHSGVKEIVLDSNIILSDDERFKYKGGINWDVDDLVIDGGGHTIDACCKARIFNVTGRNLILKRVILKNAYIEKGCGGAICNLGELLIKNAVFESNVINAEYGNNDIGGGAIANVENAKLEVIGCNFKDNFAEISSSGGGAISNSGVCLVKNSIFNENTGNWYGGALNNLGMLKVICCNFMSNHSKFQGAAINNDGESSIEESCFFKNRSFSSAGAIYNSGHLDIIESTFSRNRAIKTDGGAIANVRESKCTLINSNFKNNFAHERGGAIYNHNGCELTIENSNFEDNISEHKGGAIYNIEVLNIIDSNFIRNASQYGDGGAIINDSGNLKISNSDFCDNYAEGLGGAIRSYNLLDIADSNFKCNSSDSKGGAIYVSSGKINIKGSTFEANSSKSGGVIYNQMGELMIGESTLSKNIKTGKAVLICSSYSKVLDCKFLNNESENIVLTHDYMEIHNSVFKDNCSCNVIFNHQDSNIRSSIKSNLSIFYSNFQDNVTKYVIFNDGIVASISSTRFSNNLSLIDSRSIINETDLTLIKPKITDNGKSILNHGMLLVKNPPHDFKSKIEGDFEVVEIPDVDKFDFRYLDDMIHGSDSTEIVLDNDISMEKYERDFYEGGVELDIDGLTIDGEGKCIDGGNLSRIFTISASNITLRNIVFKNGHTFKHPDNSSNDYGGALRITHHSSLTIEDCKFLNCKSEDSGGAIQVNCNVDLMIIGCEFDECLSESFGGAIINHGELFIEDSSFSNNHADDYGGGAISNNGNLNVFNSSFLDNFVTGILGYGGAIKNEGMLEAVGCEFSQNRANSSGAAFHNGGTLIVAHSIISQNAARNSGGAINNGGEVIITNSIICSNKTRHGDGGAILNMGDVFISDSKIIANEANDDNGKTKGGAISNHYGTVEIINSSILDNISQEYAGAIYNNDGREEAILKIRDSVLSGNSAKFGGAICSYNLDELEIDNCTFEDNTYGDIFKDY